MKVTLYPTILELLFFFFLELNKNINTVLKVLRYFVLLKFTYIVFFYISL